VEAKKEMRKRIVRELQIMHGCHSDYIVNFYGAFLNYNNDVIMCMEYMDVGLVFMSTNYISDIVLINASQISRPRV
jgi:serine/threonine protein kinase